MFRTKRILQNLTGCLLKLACINRAKTIKNFLALSDVFGKLLRLILCLFNRRPKPGARPIVMLHPFGPVKFVYELSDTEGDGFPPEVLNPFKADGKISDKWLEGFIKCNLYLNGFKVYRENYGTNLAGQVQAVNKLGIHYGKRFRLPFAITVTCLPQH